MFQCTNDLGKQIHKTQKKVTLYVTEVCIMLQTFFFPLTTVVLCMPWILIVYLRLPKSAQGVPSMEQHHTTHFVLSGVYRHTDLWTSCRNKEVLVLLYHQFMITLKHINFYLRIPRNYLLLQERVFEFFSVQFYPKLLCTLFSSREKHWMLN